jgi:putative transposase
MLFYFNNEAILPNPFRELKRLLMSDVNSTNNRFAWPSGWSPRKPLVKILTFALMENHYHLLLKEIIDGGISMFMKRLGIGMTKYFNEKYQEVGTLFQGSYKAKLVDEDLYLRYLSVYIQVKNPFELYPGGIEAAVQNFDDAYKFATFYPYCSLGDYADNRNSPITDRDILAEMFRMPKEYKEFAQECILGMNLGAILGPVAFDE